MKVDHFPLCKPVCVCVSDHYMQVLNCKQHCSVELASHTGRETPFEDFLPSQFNYLQFSYYNSESQSFLLQPVPRSVHVLYPGNLTVIEVELNPKCTEIYSVTDYTDGQIY